MELIYEKSQAGPPRRDASRLRPARARGAGGARAHGAAAAARAAENEIVRHFTTLADRNFGVDTGFYPLGSCTMKYNPRVNERVVRGCPGFRDLHPHQEDDGAQGALELMWELQEILAEVAGLPARHAAAGRGLAGRADRADADARVLRRPRRGRPARHDHHRRHGARDEPGERDDGGLQAREGRDDRARQPRPRRPAREGERAHGGADADEPVHARPLRRGHRGGGRDLPRRAARSSTTTART